MLIGTSAFAQTHWISGEASFIGGGARYEYMINRHLSLGLNAYYNFFVFWNNFGTDLTARFYATPTFFLGVGLGFHKSTSLSTFAEGFFDALLSGEGDFDPFQTGVAITPDMGWRFNVGQRGIFIQPGIKVPINFGILKTADEDEFEVGYAVIPYLGVGFTF